MLVMKFFEGKTALVVGGSGGIGAALSLRLAEQGATVVVHGGHESEKFSGLMEKIRVLSPQSSAFVQHFSPETFSALPQTPLFRHARECDLLCVCHGPFVYKTLEDTTAEDWERMALLDYALPGMLVSAVLPRFKEKKWGRILLFGGTGTDRRTEYRKNAAYAGAKSALNVLVRSVAACYGSLGITCNAVLPGCTLTEYTENGDGLSGKMPGKLPENLPEEMLLEPLSVADCAMMLLSNQHLNGVLLPVDKGWQPSFS